MLGRDDQEEVEFVADKIHDLSVGTGPLAATVSTFSDFHKLVMSRLECFFVGSPHMVPEVLARTITTSSEVTTEDRGRDGFTKLYHRTKQCFADEAGERIRIKDLRCFKTFRWMLTEQQSDDVRSWWGTCAARDGDGEATTTTRAGAICDGAKGCDALVATGIYSVGGSSSSSTSASTTLAKSGTKRQLEQASKAGEKDANMMRFFKGKRAKA